MSLGCGVWLGACAACWSNKMPDIAEFLKLSKKSRSGKPRCIRRRRLIVFGQEWTVIRADQ